MGRQLQNGYCRSSKSDQDRECNRKTEYRDDKSFAIDGIAPDFMEPEVIVFQH